MTAKETAKLMALGLGPEWQAANATAPITNVVNGIRRGMYIAPTANQTKVTHAISMHSIIICCLFTISACKAFCLGVVAHEVQQPLPVDRLSSLLCEKAHLKYDKQSRMSDSCVLHMLFCQVV